MKPKVPFENLAHFLTNHNKHFIIYRETSKKLIRLDTRTVVSTTMIEKAMDNCKPVSQRKMERFLTHKLNLITFQTEHWHEKYIQAYECYVFANGNDKFLIYLNIEADEKLGYYGILKTFNTYKTMNGEFKSLPYSGMYAFIFYFLLYFNGALNTHNRKIFKKVMDSFQNYVS
jgi:hypothetical protein